jgi:hypothetical protein
MLISDSRRHPADHLDKLTDAMSWPRYVFYFGEISKVTLSHAG